MSFTFARENSAHLRKPHAQNWITSFILKWFNENYVLEIAHDDNEQIEQNEHNECEHIDIHVCDLKGHVRWNLWNSLNIKQFHLIWWREKAQIHSIKLEMN